MERTAGTLDFLLSCVSVPQDWSAWLKVLRPRGTLCLVGASSGTVDVMPAALVIGQKSMVGSVIGSRSRIREMLQVAARHGITARTEVLPMAQVNAAIDKVRENRARYRMVLSNQA